MTTVNLISIMCTISSWLWCQHISTGFKGDTPLISTETGHLTVCGCSGTATFLLKKCLKILGSAPGTLYQNSLILVDLISQSLYTQQTRFTGTFTQHPQDCTNFTAWDHTEWVSSFLLRFASLNNKAFRN